MIHGLIELLILVSMLAVSIFPVSAQNGRTGRAANSRENGARANCQGQGGVSALPFEALSPQETDALLYMREEEKLARDTYWTLWELWGTPVFQKIRFSEQRHMDAVAVLLEKYGLPDPASEERGVFSHPDLQLYYEQLVKAGSVSPGEALVVGATIEDLDLYDLNEARAFADSEDVLLVFENLARGSRNHLRSFTQLLSLAGIPYQAQFLSPEEVEATVMSPMERGGSGRGRRSNSGRQNGSAACQG